MIQKSTKPNGTSELTDEELLELYLSLPGGQRERRFADTRRAAEFVGVSLRTIQFWIETGAIRAIVAGNRYRADLDSVRKHLKERMSTRQW